MIVVADDLTGAADSGIKFSEYGLSSEIILNEVTHSDADVQILTTESRGMTPEEAKLTVTKSLASHSSCDFKKIDSTLRGNIGAELEACLEKADVVFLCPALPDLGRTVQRGMCLLNGLPIHQTALANDPLNPMEDCLVKEIIANQSSISVKEVVSDISQQEILDLYESGYRVFSFDAKSNEELNQIIKAGRESHLSVLFTGSSGLALALAKEVGQQQPAVSVACQLPVLFVSGSVHPATLEQLSFLKENFPIMSYIASADNEQSVIDSLEHSGLCIVSSCLSTKDINRENSFSLTDLAHFVSSVLGKVECQLVIVGGETCQQIFKTLKADSLRLKKELAPGIPASELIINSREIPLATKSGAFGDNQTLLEILKNLREELCQISSL